MANSDTAAIRAYHEDTKHSVARLRRDPHLLDWDDMPMPWKVYPDLDGLPLPDDFTTSSRPVLAVLDDPGHGWDQPPIVDRALLAHLLYFAAGVLRRKTYPGGEIFFRAAACTGALYHIDLYVVAGPLADLDAGVWHFGPHDFALRRLRTGDHRATLVAAAAAEPAVRGAQAVLVYTTTFWRNAWKYRTRAYRHAFWDAGTLLANLLAEAAARGLPARVVEGFVDADVNRLLDLDVAREVSLGLVALGRDGTPPAPAPPTPALGLATLPLSPHEVAYPAIVRAHEAGVLATPEDVTAWRDATLTAATASSGDARPLAPVDPNVVREPIETVIVRRGSTRRFPRRSIGFEHLSAILHAAAAPVPADVVIRPDLYVIAHAVDDLPAGTYAFDPVRRALRPLRAGDVRAEATHLDLGQELAGDAAVNLYWLIDLDPVLAALGNRGYRAAQLAAAIAGGKTYLAAYALGLGATGLTFFDDDVTQFFSPDAAGKSVLFLMAIGRRLRRQS